MTEEPTVETAAESDIESDIDQEPYDQYAVIEDDGQTLVLGIREIMGHGDTFRCGLYGVGDGRAVRLRDPWTRSHDHGDLPRVAAETMEAVLAEDGRAPAEIVRDGLEA